MKKGWIYILILSLALSYSFLDAPPPIVGVWQGVNNQGSPVRIEFSEDGRYALQIGGKTLISPKTEDNLVTYTVTPHPVHLQIALVDATDQVILGELIAGFPEKDRLQLTVITTEGNSVSEPDILLNRVPD